MATDEQRDALKALIPDTMIPDATLEALYDTADILIDDVGLKLSDELIAEIKKYVAAHLTTNIEHEYKKEGTGGWTDEYSEPTLGENLMGSRFGQTACMLDTTGTLRTLGAPSAFAEAIGVDATADNSEFFWGLGLGRNKP